MNRKEMAGRAAGVLARSGVLGALERAERSRGRLRILAYHRVDEPEAEPDLDPGLLSATPAEFREQVDLIAARYQPVSLDDLFAAHRGERPLPPRAVLLTFDDGYEDFARHAWPILREAGVPAVLFVPTAFPDRSGPGFWWDRLHAALRRTERRELRASGLAPLPLGSPAERRAAHRAVRDRAKSLPHDEAMGWLDGLIGDLAPLPSLHRVLGWDALRELASEGLAVCSHGHRHALCTRLSDPVLAEDLAVSKAEIESRLGPHAPPPAFAYPASARSRRVDAAVEAAGYELAFGGVRGIDRVPLDRPFSLMRMPANRYGTALFRAQLRPSVSQLGRWVVDARARRSA